MQNLEIKSGPELVTNLKILVGRERQIGVEILEYLCEVDGRKLHLELGYSSLFEFTVKELKYSEGSAYRRIAAMQAMREIPILKEKIATGLLNISTIADVACVLKAEAKRERSATGSPDGSTTCPPDGGAKPVLKLNVQEKRDLYLSFTGRSSRQVKQELAARFSEVQSNVVRAKEFKAVINRELESKILEFKALASHRLKTGTDEETLALMLELSLKQLKRERTGKREEKNSTRKEDLKKNTHHASAITDVITDVITITSASGSPSGSVLCSPVSSTATSAPENRCVKNSRYIPIGIKQLVWKRAQHKCEYIHQETQTRCATTHYLQLEHIKPYSHGGSSTDHENLRLLCGAHNRYLWNKFSENSSYLS